MALALLASASAGTPAAAKVTALSDYGFVSEHVVVLAAAPTAAYEALTRKVHLWWDAAHSHSGDASNFSLDDRAGGCFCERLANGGSVQHMQVVYAQPGGLLRLRGGLGPLQGMGVSGSMTFAFEQDEETGGTVLRYRYEVGGFTKDGLAALAAPVDRVQLGQLMRLRNFLAESQGKGQRPRSAP